MPAGVPSYLAPYLRAAERCGAGFGSLLWASPSTQHARFEAIRRACNPGGKRILDVGCGRADFCDFLLKRGVRYVQYTGLEAVDELAAAARRKAQPRSLIVRGDFVKEPARLLVGADLVVFSGSLNTLDTRSFYATIRVAFDAAAGALVFNFLASPMLAAQSYLTWHKPEDVLAAIKDWTPRVRVLDDYLEGDCTVALLKEDS